MRKLLLSLAFVLIAGTSQLHAQTSLLSVASKPLDTVTNTGVKALKNALPIKGAKQTVTIVATVTKLTGTAAGTVILQGSLDGVNFDRVRSANLMGAVAVDSLLIKDVATPQVRQWTVVNSPFLFYRTQATGVGTTTFTIKGQYLDH